jgi:acyl-CoA thioesterase-2
MSDAPTPQQLVDGLIRLLDVTPTEEDHFAGRRKPGGVGRVFGGQVIAQALAAAERTVAEDRPVHSLHAYFLRGGRTTRSTFASIAISTAARFPTGA